MKIYLASDHGGFYLKEQIKKWLAQNHYRFEDLGNTVLDPEDDYPDFALAVAVKVAKEADTTGILFCRSGAGMAFAANKVKGIRAVVPFDNKSVVHARMHNNANILCLSGDWFNFEKCTELISLWLSTLFNNEERHVRRINKITNYEITINNNVI